MLRYLILITVDSIIVYLEILAQVPGANLKIIKLNLASLASVREFAKEFLDNYERLDILINNAG